MAMRFLLIALTNRLLSICHLASNRFVSSSPLLLVPGFAVLHYYFGLQTEYICLLSLFELPFLLIFYNHDTYAEMSRVR